MTEEEYALAVAPRKPPFAPLEVGDIAWCLVYENPTGTKGRVTLAGVAQVLVEQIAGDGDSSVYRVVVVRGSDVIAGRRLEYTRAQLYARKDRGEHAAFGKQVERFWGSPR